MAKIFDMQNNKYKKLSEFYKEVYNSIPDKTEKITQAGSPRFYCRFYNGNTSVLGVYSENISETETFIYFSKVFNELNLNTPEIYAVSLDKTCYFIKDFGDDLLLNLLLKAKKGELDFENVISYYKKSLTALLKLQILAKNNIDFSKAFSIQKFDSQAILFDLNYFKYYFLNRSGVSFDEKLLQDDFEKLAFDLENQGAKLFMFRDFQARNILVQNEEVYFIDYQGGRLGAPEYDLVSLLYQAKADLPENIKLELKDFYFSEIKKYFDLNKQDFDERFYKYAYLRVLQTFGAYGLRGLIEKKQHFVDSIPFAIKNLKNLMIFHPLSDEFAELKRVLNELVLSKKFDNKIFDEFTVQIFSFSFKKGLPEDLSGNGGGFVFDCRGIHNPGRYPEFKDKTGKDQQAIDFFKTKTDIDVFIENAKLSVNSTIENYIERGFNSLMISFGCTGGQHRSVYCAEAMAKYITEKFQVNVILRHREQE